MLAVRIELRRWILQAGYTSLPQVTCIRAAPDTD